MKNSLLLIISLLSFEVAADKYYYETDQYGLQKLNPSVSVDDYGRVYKHDQYGLRNLNPSYEMEKRGDRVDVYETDQYGLRKLNPSYTIEDR